MKDCFIILIISYLVVQVQCDFDSMLVYGHRDDTVFKYVPSTLDEEVAEFIHNSGPIEASCVGYNHTGYFFTNGAAFFSADLTHSKIYKLHDFEDIIIPLKHPIGVRAHYEYRFDVNFPVYTFHYQESLGHYELVKLTKNEFYTTKFFAPLPVGVSPIRILPYGRDQQVFASTTHGLFYLNNEEDDFRLIDGTESFVIHCMLQVGTSIVFSVEGESRLFRLQESRFNVPYVIEVFLSLDIIVEQFYLVHSHKIVVYSGPQGLKLYDYSETPANKSLHSIDSVYHSLVFDLTPLRSKLTTIIIIIAIFVPLMIFTGVFVALIRMSKTPQGICGRCRCCGCNRSHDSRYVTYTHSDSESEIQQDVSRLENGEKNSNPDRHNAGPNVVAVRATSEENRNEETQKNKCFQCDNRISCILTPCEHKVLCLECANVLNGEGASCPECSQRIESVWPL